MGVSLFEKFKVDEVVCSLAYYKKTINLISTLALRRGGSTLAHWHPEGSDPRMRTNISTLT